jgi:GDP-mannose transporter
MSDHKNDAEDVRGLEKQAFLAPGSPPRISSREASTVASLSNSPGASILAYCFASISMTVVNKYVVSGDDWNLYFFYLAIQVCPYSIALYASR